MAACPKDHALRLTDTGADALTGRNGRHLLVGLLRQSVFGRLAGYENVSDASRLYHDPAMPWVVDGSAPMGQFKRAILASNPPEIWRMSVLRGRIIVCAFCEVAHTRNVETCLTLKIPPSRRNRRKGCIMANTSPSDGMIRRLTVSNHPDLVDVYRYSVADEGWLFMGQERRGELPAHQIAEIDNHPKPTESV
jgi:hypothetical protein